MNMLGRPANLYAPTDPVPKTARYRLTDPRTGLCRYYHAKPRLLAAAKKLIAQGVTPRAESLNGRPPGRPKGSLQKTPLGTQTHWLEQRYTAEERLTLSLASQTLKLSVADFIQQTALLRARYILGETKNPLTTP